MDDHLSMLKTSERRLPDHDIILCSTSPHRDIFTHKCEGEKGEKLPFVFKTSVFQSIHISTLAVGVKALLKYQFSEDLNSMSTGHTNLDIYIPLYTRQNTKCVLRPLLQSEFYPAHPGLTRSPFHWFLKTWPA